MYADDIILTATSEQSAVRMFEEWNAQLAAHGLKVNIGKTKAMSTGDSIEPTTTGRWPCSVCKAGVHAAIQSCVNSVNNGVTKVVQN